MKQPSEHVAEVWLEYLKYAALIKRVDFQTLLKRFERAYYSLHPSLKRNHSRVSYVRHRIQDTVESYEAQNGLRKSTTYSRRPDAAHRAWNNMLANRAALAA